MTARSIRLTSVICTALFLSIVLMGSQAQAQLFGPRVVVVPTTSYAVVSPAPVVVTPTVVSSVVPTTTIVSAAPVYQTSSLFVPTTTIYDAAPSYVVPTTIVTPRRYVSTTAFAPRSYVVPTSSIVVQPTSVQYIVPRSYFVTYP
jgi:hypothetical protein